MGKYTTHGPTATEIHEPDLEGNDFVIGNVGQIVPCTRSGSTLTKRVAAAPNRVMLPSRLQREMEIVFGLWGFDDMAHEADLPYYAVTKSGSTTSAIKILEPVLANATAAYQVWVLDGTPRPPYTASSISGGDTVNLASAMSEAAPAAGVLVIIRYPPKLLPNSTDFTNPSIGVKVGGTWYVAERGTGKVWRATAGADLAKIATGSGTLDLPVGAVAGNANITVNNKPRGNWDFSAATVTGLPGSSTPTGTGFRHVAAGVEDASAKLVENADVHASAAIAVSKLDNGSALSVLGRSANSAGARADMAAGTDGHVLRRSGTTLGFGTVQSGGIADGSITNAKLANDTGPSIIGIPSNVLSAPTYIGSPGTNDVMREDGSGDIGWGKISVEALAAAGNGDILFYDDANSRWALLGIGSEGDVLKVSGGLPTWQAP